MEQYKKAELQKMELVHMRNILKLKTENNVERAKIEAMERANEAIRSDLPKLQKQNVELQLVKEARQAELSHAEDQHNQYLQLQHEHERLEQVNRQLQFQIDVTLADSTADVISKAKDQLEQNARLQLVKELVDQTLAKEKEKNVSQMNLAAQLEKNRQIREHKFDKSIQKLAKDQVEADQLKQKAEAQSHAKDEALYEVKNKYNDVANVHHDWLTTHGAQGDARVDIWTPCLI